MYGLKASRIMVGIGLGIGFVLLMPLIIKAFKETWVEMGLAPIEGQGAMVVVLVFIIFAVVVISLGVLIVGMIGVVSRVIQDIGRARINRQIRLRYNNRLTNLESDIALIKGHLGIEGEVVGDDD